MKLELDGQIMNYDSGEILTIKRIPDGVVIKYGANEYKIPMPHFGLKFKLEIWEE